MAKNKSNNNFPFADIHTHILHSIDDGSSSVDESLELLKREKSQGVTKIVLTPHFDLENISIEEFVKVRDERFQELLKAVENEPELKGLSLHLGAEVKFTPYITNNDVKKLAIEGTNCILLELPLIDPFYLDETVDYLMKNNLVPIFAHIERCAYLRSSKKLKFYKNKGVIMQSNTSVLLRGELKRFAIKMIKKGYIDVLASDTHNVKARPPAWDDAYSLLNDTLKEKITRNSLELF